MSGPAADPGWRGYEVHGTTSGRWKSDDGLDWDFLGRCRFCTQPQERHPAGKCLYDATMYVPEGDPDVQAAYDRWVVRTRDQRRWQWVDSVRKRNER